MLRIKEVAKEHNVGIGELASLIGVAQPSMSNIVNEKSMPSLETLQKIADALNVEVWELFDRENKTELTALVEYKKEFYKAETLQELKTIVSKIETAEKE